MAAYLVKKINITGHLKKGKSYRAVTLILLRLQSQLLLVFGRIGIGSSLMCLLVTIHPSLKRDAL